eukprot:TRINITY_DN458_c0_g1_i1.p1 TRINITY_DN458_c0_g1~~TRINITY_DN458_c0_g1_i1.p1  ORF type:complete len:400 (+),score=51.29 TRINITY_DN458_c0_g1_i1:239-1438(+)
MAAMALISPAAVSVGGCIDGSLRSKQRKSKMELESVSHLAPLHASNFLGSSRHLRSGKKYLLSEPRTGWTVSNSSLESETTTRTENVPSFSDALNPLTGVTALELPGRIWMSDVVAERKRPYFLNREWTAKDVTYATYLSAVHLLCLAAPLTFSWDAFGVFFGLYVVTGMLGITLSFHRHLSHKSFKIPKYLEYFFAYCGVLAAQGPPMEWVSAHRYHHQHCDTPMDPHTPYEGFWHSHMGWLLDDEATSERVGRRSNIADMINDPFYNFIEQTYPIHIIASVVALYVARGFPYIVWGMALRVVWVYHITWAVNSAAHVWGFQQWNTGDLSCNNWWVALLAFGEGWHNNHHAFEYSARHGLEWWQFDVTYYIVKLLEWIGLATKVRLPTPEHMARLSLK